MFELGAIDTAFLLMVAVGFAAQMCDGVLGMGFGLISSTVLLATGVPPAVAAAAVNGAKIFTGSLQSLFHWRAGNIDRALALRLSVFGIIGGVIGALMLVKLPMPWLKPVISSYLVLVGVYILVLAGRPLQLHRPLKPLSVALIGASGGALEATAGVYGPLVTSNLAALGADPRRVIGSGTLSETVVALGVFAILVHHIGFGAAGRTIAALLIGALLAAPIAGRITANVPRRYLLLGIGVLVIVSSMVRLLKS